MARVIPPRPWAEFDARAWMDATYPGWRNNAPAHPEQLIPLVIAARNDGYAASGVQRVTRDMVLDAFEACKAGVTPLAARKVWSQEMADALNARLAAPAGHAKLSADQVRQVISKYFPASASLAYNNSAIADELNALLRASQAGSQTEKVQE